MRLLALLFIGLFSFAVSTVHARDFKAGGLDITDPWFRATPKGASVAGGYMKIKNDGSTPDRLIGGSSDVASKFEVHEMKMENGIAKMRPLEGGWIGNQARRDGRTQARIVPCHVHGPEKAAHGR
jgi:periplasmic copper chaperone A